MKCCSGWKMEKKKLIEDNYKNLLLWLDEHNMITYSREMSAIVDMKKRDIIAQHKETNKIWQGKDKRYYTYVGIGARRVLRSSKDLPHLEEIIIAYYLEHKLVRADLTSFEYLFYESCGYAVESNHLKKNTIDRYACDYRKFFENSDFVKKRVQDITAIDVADFLDYVLNQFDVTEKCFCNIKSLMLFVFSYAKQRRRIECLNISATFHDLRFANRRFKRNIVKSKTQVFNVEETPLLSQCIEKEFRDIRDLGLLLMLHTGLRVGELSALKWDCVKEDVLEVRLTECKEMRDGKTTYFNDLPKQGHIRDVYLSTESKRILALIDCLQKEKRIISEYVVCDDIGLQCHCYMFNRALKHYCKKLGILERSPHKLRKTYSTAMLDCGCDVKFVQEQMGHSDIQTTYKSYQYTRQVENTFINFADKVSLELKKESNQQI